MASTMFGPGRDRPTILIVHADPWVRALVSQVLLEANYAVVQASNGASGLRAVARVRPSAILMGDKLSEIRNADFVDAVQAEYPNQGIGFVELDHRLLTYFQDRLGRCRSF